MSTSARIHVAEEIQSTPEPSDQQTVELIGKLLKHGLIDKLFEPGNKFMEKLIQSSFMTPPVDIYVLPGGRMPRRMKPESIGFDAYARAVVSPTEMDPKNLLLRKPIYDFLAAPDPRSDVAEFIEARKPDPNVNDYEYYWRLDPGKQVTIGIGFVTRMPYPLKYWVAPRSGLSSRLGVTVSNAPGTVDPDYRGEAGANIFNHGTEPFYIGRDTRIVQLLFSWTCIPVFGEVKAHADLMDDSDRGAEGFGSTGGFVTNAA